MVARLPLHLRMIHHLLQRLNYHFSSTADYTSEPPFHEEALRQAEEALRQLPVADNHTKAYLAKHLPRLARTLALVPPAGGAGRALELGCYMQITPFLQRLRGYTEVRGAYYGPIEATDPKTVEFS
ncbi:MAG: hypothetical protein HY236_11505 [Acidobacteria bacterium]|nr:hypothetical protein [Acidobacteriota bacterium]